MKQDDANVITEQIKIIFQALEVLMSFDPLTRNLVMKRSIGNLSGELTSWLDFDFLKVAKSEHPNIDFSGLEIDESKE